jgi:hypothetical protein
LRGYYKEKDRVMLLKYYAENPNSLMPVLHRHAIFTHPRTDAGAVAYTRGVQTTDITDFPNIVIIVERQQVD